MRELVLLLAVLLLIGCSERQDSRTYRNESGSLEVSGTLDDENILRVEINGQKVIEETIVISDGKVVATVSGTYEQQPANATCTVSTFSNEPELFCTVTLNSKEIATLRFR